MINSLISQKGLILLLTFFFHTISADSFFYNSYNNHGVLGLINIPTARIYDEGGFGVTLYDGTPDQKLTITSSPYSWLETSFFYTNIQGKPYGNGYKQDYKDKGFNLKIKLKDEGKLPALAIGVYDIAGTGYYASEYLVASYGIKNLDIHFGLGWGALNGTEDYKNPLISIDNRFSYRPEAYAEQGGQFQPSRYFSDKTVSPFFGLAYSLNDSILLKLERDTTLTPGEIGFEEASTRISYGLDYKFNKNFTIGLAKERNNFYSLRFIYKQDASSSKNQYKYKKARKEKNDTKYDHLIKNLESNGLGVNKIVEGADNIGIEITQFSHPNLNIINDIVKRATAESNIDKNVKTELRIADLKASSEFTNDLEKEDTKLIYERKKTRNFYSSNKISFRPFLASREGFFRYAILAENNSEYIIKDNFFFSSNIKYSIYDNFDDLVIPPQTTYPAQVRSDVKDYLRTGFDHPIIGRAQFDYHKTLSTNNHLMFTGGILEEMFSGYGFEYLYFNNKKNYAFGFEIFDVVKRDYEMRLGTTDYKNITGSINFYYRNYKFLPFDAEISYGEYLAGDIGTSIELSRSYRNGAKFGVFASFTDVTSDQFGEGSFDKGIFFSIPIYRNFVNYTWRPLTKDPGAKLNRKHSLHDLLVRFKPID